MRPPFAYNPLSMATILLTDDDEGVFRFPVKRQRDAFGACELIADRLEMEAQVVRRRDEETKKPFFAIRLVCEGRDPRREEVAEALEVCRIVLRGGA